MKHKKKILLVGGEGFLGRNISRVLSEKDDCFSADPNESIFGVGRLDAYLKKNPYEEKIEGKYDIFVHLVDSKAGPDEFSKQEQKLQNNIKVIPNAHIIIFSSAAVYANPDSDYAKRKKELENIWRKYCTARDLRYTILRLFNTFGSYQLPNHPGSLVANVFCNYLLGKSLVINDPDARRDFIYAGDVAEFINEIIRSGHTGTIDLGSGKLISIRKLLDIIQKEVIEGPISIEYRNLRESISAVAAKKKFLPAATLTPMKTALKQAFDFYKNNLGIIKKYA